MIINTTDNSLKLFLQTKLNKKIEDINEFDLSTIDILNVDSRYIDGTINVIDFSIISLFPNLRVINISNTVLTNSSLNYLSFSSISEINLINCTFEDNVDYSIIKDISILSLYRCYIDNYDILFNNLKNIVHLQVIKPYDDNEIDISLLNSNLEILVLEQCIVKNYDMLERMDKCFMLSLLGSNLVGIDLNFINKMKALKYLFLSEKCKFQVDKLLLNDNIEVRYNLNDFVYDYSEHTSYKG